MSGKADDPTALGIDSLEGLVSALKRGPGFWVPETSQRDGTGHRHCSSCGGQRKHRISLIGRRVGKVNYASDVYKQISPACFEYQCLQCDAISTALLYKAPDNYSLAVFPDHHGGIRTPLTPKSVAYYLDEAWNARCVGARSAAVAMYRAALEQLLFDQGFTAGTLATKIKNLDQAVEKGEGPSWAGSLGTDEMSTLRLLGNGSIHPNDGDIEKQKVLDDKLLNVIEEYVTGLLAQVYEVHAKQEEARRSLRAAASSMEKVRT